MIPLESLSRHSNVDPAILKKLDNGVPLSSDEEAAVFADMHRLEKANANVTDGVLKVQEMLDFIRPQLKVLSADACAVDAVAIKIAVSIVENVMQISVDHARLMKEEAEFSAYLSTNPKSGS